MRLKLNKLFELEKQGYFNYKPVFSVFFIVVLLSVVSMAERVNLDVNGEKALGEIVDGHLYVEMTSLKQLVNRIAWFPASGVIAIFHNDKTAKLTVGSRQANVDGEIQTLEHPALLKSGNVLIPGEVLSGVFNLKLSVDHSSERPKTLVDISVTYSEEGLADVELITTQPLRPGEWNFIQEKEPDRIIITLFRCGIAIAGEAVEAKTPLSRVIYGTDDGFNARVVIYTKLDVGAVVLPAEGDMGLHAFIGPRESLTMEKVESTIGNSLNDVDKTSGDFSAPSGEAAISGISYLDADTTETAAVITGNDTDEVNQDIIEKPPLVPGFQEYPSSVTPEVTTASEVNTENEKQISSDTLEATDFQTGETMVVETMPSEITTSVPVTEVNEISRDVLTRLNAKRTARQNRNRSQAPEILVAIDPGHGGRDTGVRINGESESSLVLDIAVRLSDLLNEFGIKTLLTRETDADVVGFDRATRANIAGAAIYLSLHINASYSHRARGMELFIMKSDNDETSGVNSSNTLDPVVADRAMRNWRTIRKREETRRYASIMREALAQELPVTVAEIREERLMPLQGLSMPGIVVEMGYLTNAYERKLLTNSYYREELADALAEAVRRYAITTHSESAGEQ